MAMVEYETRGRIGIFTLNRPEARNAVNGEVAADMEAAVDRFEDDPDVWVGVITATLTGDRPVFSAGADLKAVNTAAGAGISTQKGGFAGFAYRERTKPVIAAVDGLATAGGCEIVLACDLVVASTRSSFGLAEVKRNLVAGAGGLFRLPRAIGRAAAMEVILTGEPLSAQRAHELGLVNRSVRTGGVARHCDRPRRADLPLRADGGAREPQDRPRVRLRGRRDAEEDDEQGDGERHGVRGPEGRSGGVRREARTELDGSLTSTHDTVFDQEVLEAVDEGELADR